MFGATGIRTPIPTLLTEGKRRMVSNQKGQLREMLAGHRPFNPALVIEI